MYVICGLYNLKRVWKYHWILKLTHSFICSRGSQLRWNDKNDRKDKEDRKDKKNDKKDRKDKEDETSISALTAQVKLRSKMGWNAEAAGQYVNAPDGHQVCLYNIFNVGSNFECECRPMTGAKVFHEVDTNNYDIITSEEMLAF